MIYRIIFFHVPAAITAMLCAGVTFVTAPCASICTRTCTCTPAPGGIGPLNDGFTRRITLGPTVAGAGAAGMVRGGSGDGTDGTEFA